MIEAYLDEDLETTYEMSSGVVVSNLHAKIGDDRTSAISTLRHGLPAAFMTGVPKREFVRLSETWSKYLAGSIPRFWVIRTSYRPHNCRFLSDVLSDATTKYKMSDESMPTRL
jgi:hypothetical protein